MSLRQHPEKTEHTGIWSSDAPCCRIRHVQRSLDMNQAKHNGYRHDRPEGSIPVIHTLWSA